LGKAGRQCHGLEVVVSEEEVVVVVAPEGATGERGEAEVVVSSVVVVVLEEVGIESSLLAQPASRHRPAAARDERIRCFIAWMMEGVAALASTAL
jgi:hypothetical protein